MDSTSRYLVLFAVPGKQQKCRLVRIDDLAGMEVPAPPDDAAPSPGRCVLDLSVEAFEDPVFGFFLLDQQQKQCTAYKYQAGEWETSEPRNANQEQLAAARTLSSQTAFVGEQVQHHTKETPSPDGRYVLFEYAKTGQCCAELRRNGGKLGLRLTSQTDQFWEGLRKLGE